MLNVNSVEATMFFAVAVRALILLYNPKLAKWNPKDCSVECPVLPLQSLATITEANSGAVRNHAFSVNISVIHSSPQSFPIVKPIQ